MGLILKPRVGLRLNYNHPLAEGLVAGWLFNEHSGIPYDIFNHDYVTQTSSPIWKPDGLYFDGTDDRMHFNRQELPTLGDATIIVIYVLHRNDPSDGIWGIFADVAANRWGGFWTGNGTFQPTFFRYSSTIHEYKEVFVAGVAADYDGTLNFTAMHGIQDGDLDIWHGKLGGALTYATGGHTENWETYGVSDNLIFGDYDDGGGQECQVTLATLYFYNRILTETEIRYLNREPYAMFEQPRLWAMYDVAVKELLIGAGGMDGGYLGGSLNPMTG